jgi:hypothetical protein
MADSITALNDLHPHFTTKAEMMEAARKAVEPNSPVGIDFLFRLAHTDLAGTGDITGGATVTPASFGL